MTSSAKTNRDLYLMYMRQENPSYALFTREEMNNAVKSQPPTRQLAAASAHSYECTTQEHDGVAAIYLGIEKGLLHLWENGSVINWTCRKDGWPSEKASIETLIAMYRATRAWNYVMEDRVRFKYVSNLTDAAIEVRYERGVRRKLLATSFFPNDYAKDLNFIKVYRGSFVYPLPMYNTMLHELGHVLGLRHEFAQKSEKQAESIMFGIRNPRSVMAVSNMFPYVWF